MSWMQAELMFLQDKSVSAHLKLVSKYMSAEIQMHSLE